MQYHSFKFQNMPSTLGLSTMLPPSFAVLYTTVLGNGSSGRAGYQLRQAVGALLHQVGPLGLGGDLVGLLPDPVELRVTDSVVVGTRLVGIRGDALGAEVDALSRSLARRDLREDRDLEVAVRQRLAEEDARALVVGLEVEAGVLPLALQNLLSELPPLVAGGRL